MTKINPRIDLNFCVESANNFVKVCFLFAKFLIFADDVKMFNAVTSNNDLNSLQQDFSNQGQDHRMNLQIVNYKKAFSIVGFFS